MCLRIIYDSLFFSKMHFHFIFSFKPHTNHFTRYLFIASYFSFSFASLLNSSIGRASAQKHRLFSRWRLFYLLHFSIFIANKIPFYCFGFMWQPRKNTQPTANTRIRADTWSKGARFYEKRASTVIYNRFYTSTFFFLLHFPARFLQRSKWKLQAPVWYLYKME